MNKKHLQTKLLIWQLFSCRHKHATKNHLVGNFIDPLECHVLSGRPFDC